MYGKKFLIILRGGERSVKVCATTGVRTPISGCDGKFYSYLILLGQNKVAYQNQLLGYLEVPKRFQWVGQTYYFVTLNMS